MNKISELSCEQTRESIQDLLDETYGVKGGELMSGKALEVHLEGCSDCRVFRKEMAELHRGLTDLPELQFPEAALEEVWDQTVRRNKAARFDWRWLAVAAAIMIAVFGGRMLVLRESAPEYSTAEIAQATEDARAALGLVRDAIQRSEHAAIDQILGGEVTPALEKITIGLPHTGNQKRRRTGV